jgi:hypothetical protein
MKILLYLILLAWGLASVIVTAKNECPWVAALAGFATGIAFTLLFLV